MRRDRASLDLPDQRLCGQGRTPRALLAGARPRDRLRWVAGARGWLGGVDRWGIGRQCIRRPGIRRPGIGSSGIGDRVIGSTGIGRRVVGDSGIGVVGRIGWRHVIAERIIRLHAQHLVRSQIRYIVALAFRQGGQPVVRPLLRFARRYAGAADVDRDGQAVGAARREIDRRCHGVAEPRADRLRLVRPGHRGVGQLVAPRARVIRAGPGRHLRSSGQRAEVAPDRSEALARPALAAGERRDAQCHRPRPATDSPAYACCHVYLHSPLYNRSMHRTKCFLPACSDAHLSLREVCCPQTDGRSGEGRAHARRVTARSWRS